MNPQGDSKVLSDEYVAGLFDGEGCVSCTKTYIQGKYEKYPRVRMQIQIANTHTGIIQLLTKWFGGGCTDKNGRKDYKGKRCYSWRICGKTNMTRFLKCIQRHSIIKRKQIDLGLAFCGTLRDENLGCVALSNEIHSKRDEIHRKLKELKVNGL